MTETSTWTVVLLASLGTFAWRATGVVVAAHIRPDSPTFKWVACVAYAILAALIARIMVLPVGLLAATPAIDRYVALAVGFTLFFVLRRSMAWGLASTLMVFTCLSALRAYGVI